MATSKVQRYGILTILVATVIGTMGGFAVMILSTQSQAKNQKEYQVAMNKYTAIENAYQAKVKVQSDQLSTQYYGTFSPYESQPAKFDINGVKTLSTEDLVVGDGEAINGTTAFAAYYIGWDANAHIFDQSIDTSTKSLKTPLAVATGLDAANLITGWKTGMKGMNIGGIRLITIPSDQAYGAAGSTDSNGQQVVAPNMPLKFIVMAIPLPAQVPQPDVSSLIKTLQATQPQQ